MIQPPNDKLERFEQAIMQKAAAEKEEIFKSTEAQKRDELEKEKTRLLEELYRKIQAQISEIKQNDIKEISRETLTLKKKLYQQREQYLIEMLARARVELDQYVKSDAYEAFLMSKAAAFANSYKFEDSIIKVRSADLSYADAIKKCYGDCTIEADDANIAIGGAILLNHKRGIEVDLSLDTALAQQREWFYNHSNFNFE